MWLFSVEIVMFWLKVQHINFNLPKKEIGKGEKHG
jgi:hypothetical protein